MVWRLRNMAFLPKLKIAIVFYQNMLSIPVVYGLTVPPDWYRWLYVFSWVNLDVLDIYEAECMGDVESQLNMTALGSLIVVVGILMLGALFVLGMRLLGAPSTSKAGTSLREQMILLGLPWALFAVFALVPGVSRTIFRVWSCKKFIADDGDGSAIEFLVMRMSVVCGSEEHESIARLALVYLCVWPITIPLLCLALVVSCRKDIWAGNSTEWLRATQPLHYEYRAEVYYWETISLSHRLLVTGFACLISNSLGVVRMVTGVFVNIIFSMLLVIVRPYKRDDLNILATASSSIQTCGFFAALLIKLYDDLIFFWTEEDTEKVLGYKTTTDLAVLMAIFCFLFLAVVILAMGSLQGHSFRGTIHLISHDDGSLAPKVTFVTDIEGNWEYFERFVQRCEALSFPSGAPVLDDEGAADLVLADGWRFIHGGDTCDKGGVVGGSIRVVRTLCRLKRKYPNRVVLLLGNRDLNKMRMTSELNTSSIYYGRSYVGGALWPAAWVPLAKRVTPELSLRRQLAKQLEYDVDEVPVEDVDAADTLPNRLRWMYRETMGADGEFERQWGELALLQGVKKETLSEEHVAQAIVRSVCPGGWMRDLLTLGQLGFIHKDALFVHGGLVGGPWEGSNDGVDCFGYVPGRTERLTGAKEWITALNEWKQAQLAEWLEQPLWIEPEGLKGPNNPPTRAASAIIDYVCPGCVPSVVMGRQLSGKGMPQALPTKVVARLNRSGIHKLFVGHTPHGNAPTLMQSEGLLMVMADTSYSDMSAADNRGSAISEVQILEDGAVRVCGSLHDTREFSFSLPSSSQPLVGCLLPAFPVPRESAPGEEQPGYSSEMMENELLRMLGGREYFVKAWLDQEQQYLLCNVDGFVVSYATLGKREAQALFDKATEQAREEAARAAAAEEEERRRQVLEDGSSSGRSPRTPRVESARSAQASWLGRLLQRGSDKSELEYTADIVQRSSSEVQLSSLGDADIIGLPSESMKYAQQTLEKRLSDKNDSAEHLTKQAKRLKGARRGSRPPMWR